MTVVLSEITPEPRPDETRPDETRPDETGPDEAERRREMADFLRRRREAINPAQVGLPVGGRRRTPGLRREEVAQIAGVGVTWYTWLEQAREIRVSENVLDALSRALLLDSHERAHLFNLGGRAQRRRDYRIGHARSGRRHPARALRHLSGRGRERTVRHPRLQPRVQRADGRHRLCPLRSPQHLVDDVHERTVSHAARRLGVRGAARRRQLPRVRTPIT